ncbi:hypothetical protein [Geomicrobium sp. JCM 19038]|uniref:hypothetical protein n=1 Tax=Geomicrobium sp. JCM 19038 TaxID=1460635 RepID=UPI00045F18BD|nr:hypothetical protein [Geomicrobium sp. JCM 19038]GAK09151.1 hypothetical protein JCM19038_2972 [Geomicrobium sp. JCM 19038]
MKKYAIVNAFLIGSLFLHSCDDGAEDSQVGGTDNNMDEEQELPEDDEENNVDDEPLDLEGEDFTEESDIDNEEASSDEEEIVSETVYLYYIEDTEESDAQRYKEQTTIYAAVEDELYWAAIHTWASDKDHMVGDVLVSHGVDVDYVAENDGVAEVSFSEELYDIDFHLPINDVFHEQVGLMMMEFGYESTQILVNGEAIDGPLLIGDQITDRPFRLHEDRKEEYEERN